MLTREQETEQAIASGDKEVMQKLLDDYKYCRKSFSSCRHNRGFYNSPLDNSLFNCITKLKRAIEAE